MTDLTSDVTLDGVPATAPELAADTPIMAFAQLQLAAPLARAVAEMGYTSMTPIQAQAIPVVLQGRDVMGAAQTGTGKTAAFALPLLQRLLKHENSSTSPARHPVRALVLLPTRELADQVAQAIKSYAQHTQLRSTVVFGGIDMKPQTLELKKGVEVLVATPGRLLDHIEAKNAVLGQVEYVVLDEADRMLDIGFLPDLQRILSYLPKQRTTLLFSATFSPEIKRLANSYLQSPVTIEVARSNATASTVEQHFYSVGDEDKRHALHQILKERNLKQAFVFVNSKLGCARLARSLEREGLNTTMCTASGARAVPARLAWPSALSPRVMPGWWLILRSSSRSKLSSKRSSLKRTNPISASRAASMTGAACTPREPTRSPAVVGIAMAVRATHRRPPNTPGKSEHPGQHLRGIRFLTSPMSRQQLPVRLHRPGKPARHVPAHARCRPTSSPSAVWRRCSRPSKRGAGSVSQAAARTGTSPGSARAPALGPALRAGRHPGASRSGSRPTHNLCQATARLFAVAHPG